MKSTYKFRRKSSIEETYFNFFRGAREEGKGERVFLDTKDGTEFKQL
jgi:hypothetical protein